MVESAKLDSLAFQELRRLQQLDAAYRGILGIGSLVRFSRFAVLNSNVGTVFILPVTIPWPAKAGRGACR